MAKDIYIYSQLYDFIAAEFAEKLDDLADKDVTVRVNSNGGDVYAGWAMIQKIREHGSISAIKVDGWACSMMAFACLFVEKVECHSASQFMFHRANGYVGTEDDQKALDNANKELRAAMKKKLDGKKFKEITGITIDMLFDAEERRDIWLTAKEAKQIGLVSKIAPMSVAAKSRMSYMNNEKFYSIAAEHEEEGGSKPSTMKDMTISVFKAEHKEIHDSLVEATIKAERDRVNAHLAFMNADPEAMVKAIKEGTEMTQTIMAEMTVKLTAKGTLKKVEDGNPDTPKVDDEGKPIPETPEAKALVIKLGNGQEVKFSAEEVKEQRGSMKSAIDAAIEGIKIN